MKNLLLVLSLVAGVCSLHAGGPNASAFSDGEGVNGEVFALAVQSDGKVVIGGRFSSVNGVPRNNIARLNADGTLDASFAKSLEDGVNGQVNALAILPAGGLIVGGQFTQLGGVESMNLGRYNADGSADKTFGSAPGQDPGANGVVYALTVQADGKIVVGGAFSTVFGLPRRGLARLNTDNTLDGPVVAEQAVSGSVRALGGTPDDSFVAGGQFTVANQSARSLLKPTPKSE